MTKDERKRRRQLRRSLKKEHRTKYKNPRYWAVMLLVFAVGVAGFFLSVITRADLFDRLTPYTGACLVAVGALLLTETLLDRRNLPGWGFLIFPAMLCAAMGALMLVFQKDPAETVVFYAAYGFLGWALALVCFGFAYKDIRGWWWIPMIIIGVFSSVPAALLILQPLTGLLTLLQWTQICFLTLEIASAVVFILMALQFYFFIRFHPVGPVFIREK